MDKLDDIFARQLFYVTSLKEIYTRNGFTMHASPMPWPIDDRKAQEEFRLLAWRITEEVVEAVETFDKGMRTRSNVEDYREEVADALHFLIELALATGVKRETLLTGAVNMPFECAPGLDSLDEFFEQVEKGQLRITNQVVGWADFLRSLALAMMVLRQRPWRTDFRLSDYRQWTLGLHLAFRTFVEACINSGIDAVELHKAYFKKAKVNDKRTEEQP